eukprot:CAMPEP_0115339614 /NCGR_PEP_ID=MMETSP0270-20121206/90709_1 /TAXON_ID=71861 /ORGANISM="Scrippsiella trochoidea, Strain CCMP3099" /LENGTH=90 /DNA_ID=CAMNT_0002761017 /DNA_START=13 /DNA_END=285 /DNA_ORIENTATION=+
MVPKLYSSNSLPLAKLRVLLRVTSTEDVDFRLTGLAVVASSPLGLSSLEDPKLSIPCPLGSLVVTICRRSLILSMFSPELKDRNSNVAAG